MDQIDRASFIRFDDGRLSVNIGLVDCLERVTTINAPNEPPGSGLVADRAHYVGHENAIEILDNLLIVALEGGVRRSDVRDFDQGEFARYLIGVPRTVRSEACAHLYGITLVSRGAAYGCSTHKPAIRRAARTPIALLLSFNHPISAVHFFVEMPTWAEASGFRATQDHE